MDDINEQPRAALKSRMKLPKKEEKILVMRKMMTIEVPIVILAKDKQKVKNTTHIHSTIHNIHKTERERATIPSRMGRLIAG